MTRVEKREMKQANTPVPCALCPSGVVPDRMLAFQRGKTTYYVEWSHIEDLLLDPRVQARMVRLWPEMRAGLAVLMPAWFSPPVARAEVDLAPLAGVVDNLRGALESLRAEVNAVVAGQKMVWETLNSNLHAREVRGREVVEVLSVIRGEIGELASHLTESPPASPPLSPAVDLKPIVEQMETGFRSIEELLLQAGPAAVVPGPVPAPAMVPSPRRGRPPGRAPPVDTGNGEETPAVAVVKKEKGGKEVSVKQRMREAILALEELGERATAGTVAEAAGIRVELVGRLAKMFPDHFKLKGEVYTVAGG